MPTIQLAPGLSLHYLDYNQDKNETVLLLHGLGVTGESWLMQVPALTQAGFRVIAPDARGFGHSTYPGGTVRIIDLAADMAGLLDDLHINRAAIVGKSIGYSSTS